MWSIATGGPVQAGGKRPNLAQQELILRLSLAIFYTISGEKRQPECGISGKTEICW